MILCGYINDRSVDYYRDTVRIVRSGAPAYIRLKHAWPGTYEVVDPTGTVVSPSHVWYSDAFENHDTLNLGAAIAKAVADAYDAHDTWLQQAMVDWKAAHGKWYKERLEWEVGLAINMAYNQGAKWMVHDGDRKVLAVGRYHRRQGDPEWNIDVFEVIKRKLVDIANAVASVDTSPPPAERPAPLPKS